MRITRGCSCRDASTMKPVATSLVINLLIPGTVCPPLLPNFVRFITFNGDNILNFCDRIERHKYCQIRNRQWFKYKSISVPPYRHLSAFGNIIHIEIVLFVSVALLRVKQLKKYVHIRRYIYIYIYIYLLYRYI